MASYLHPGVYVEEIPSGSKPIEGVATSTAVFVGATPRGEIDVPTLITSWDQYEGTYDGIRDTARDEPIDSMGYSVWAFFRNGGKKAYIMRLSGGGATLAEGYLTHPEDGTQLIRFEAVNEGAWGGRLRLTFTTTGTSQYALSIELRDQYSDANEEDGDNVQEERFTDLSLDEESPDFLPTRLEDSELVRATLVAGATDYFQGTSTSADLAGLLPVNLNGQTLNLSFDDGAEDVAVTFEAAEFTATATLADIAATIQDAVRTDSDTQGAFTAVARGTTLTLTSGTVSTESSVVASGAAAATLRLGSDNGGRELIGPEFLAGLIEDEITIVLAPGEDGSPPGSTQYDDAFTALRKYSVNIVCLPGQAWTADGNANIEAAESYAESMRTCMFLVDPQSDLELVDATGVSALGLETSTYGVLYYPWLEVSNPHYDSEKRPDRAKTVLVPPGGFAAGMWAKIDSTRGVWKAPAGTETALNGTIGAEFIVGDDEQDELNPLAVNCIRALNVAGLSARVIWGSRTLATKNKPEWRYVPVRRTAIFIEQSIYNGIQWAVFEPNDHRLWSSLRTNIDSFMNGLFRTGAFQGEKASSAYFVRCGLGDTMTQGDIDAGQVIVIVGFAPLKPAEFVIIRIQQKVGEQ